MIDVTDTTFEAEVVEASRTQPVVVDLWAPWCGPCKQLGPILEQIIADTDGKVKGVKVNVDDNPAVSQAFQVQSIPAVYALADGQVVDGFMGAQGEPAVREFIERLLPTEEETEIDRLIDAGDEASLRQALEIDAGHTDAVLALAQVLVADGRGDEALQLLSRIPESDDTRHIAALARTGASASVASDGEVEAQLEALLARVKTDDDARQEFVDLLEVMGPANPAAAEWRKRLTSALY